MVFFYWKLKVDGARACCCYSELGSSKALDGLSSSEQ